MVKKCSVALGIGLLLLFAGPAFAWTDAVHGTLSKQTVLYMLRSGVPELRMAAVAVISAGEGMQAGPALKRRWPLSDEARAVDHYREVAVRNKSKSIADIAPPLMYAFMGYGFAAFNHFILKGESFPAQHDNVPGYFLANDDSLNDLKGKFLKMASAAPGSGQMTLKDFCYKKVHDMVEDWMAKNIPNELSTPLLSLNAAPALVPVFFDMEGAIAEKVADLAASYCPELVVDHDFSTALDLYTNNSSTAKQGDFHYKALLDVRFHPVDNIATAGTKLLLNSSDLQDLGQLAGNQIAPATGHPMTETTKACKAGQKASDCIRYMAFLRAGSPGTADTLLNDLELALATYCTDKRIEPWQWNNQWKAWAKTNNALLDVTEPYGKQQAWDALVQRCTAGNQTACSLLKGGAPAATLSWVYRIPYNDSVTDHYQLISCTFPPGAKILHLNKVVDKAPDACELPTKGSCAGYYKAGLAQDWPKYAGYADTDCQTAAQNNPLVDAATCTCGEWLKQQCYPYYKEFWKHPRYSADPNIPAWPEACVVDGSGTNKDGTCYGRLLWMLAQTGKPAQGRLLHLGRLFHALQDAGQPAHVTGKLIALEHFLEEYVQQRVVYEFEGYQEDEVPNLGHAVVQPIYNTDTTSTGATVATHDLSYLFDLAEAGTEILQWKTDYLIPALPAGPKAVDATVEKIAERAASETWFAVTQHQNKKAAFFTTNTPSGNGPLGAPSVARKYMTISLVANAVGLARAMQLYYGAAWPAMVAKTSWTAKDQQVIYGASQPELVLNLPVGTLLGQSPQAKTFSTYVDAGYQEKTTFGLCLVNTHEWCSTDSSLGRPCVLPDCKNVSQPTCNPTSCPKVPCQWHITVKPLEPPAKYLPFIPPQWSVHLSAKNKGNAATDLIHVTGAATAGQMQQVFLQGPITQNAGKTLYLPPGTTSAAVWCTGPDIWNTQSVVSDPATGGQQVVQNVVCDASIEAVFNQAQLCDPLEQCLFSGGVLSKDGDCVPWNKPPANAPDTQMAKPDDMLPDVPDDLGALADRYGIPVDRLAAALAEAPTDPDQVTLLEPSPFGHASLIWQKDGRAVVVTIAEGGAVVRWRGDPGLLR